VFGQGIEGVPFPDGVDNPVARWDARGWRDRGGNRRSVRHGRCELGCEQNGLGVVRVAIGQQNGSENYDGENGDEDEAPN
jgi:hypothetical protein